MTDLYTWINITIGGLGAGMVAGIFGIGGGTIIVPLLISLGLSPIQAVGTSTITIVFAAGSGTWQNWRTNDLDQGLVLRLGISAVIFTQLGVLLAGMVPPSALLWGFASYLVVNAYMVQVRQRLAKQITGEIMPVKPHRLWQESLIGAIAGTLSGLFGVGGGVVLVPLQIILLQSAIKPAIRNSLGAVMIIGIAGCLGHSWHGNVVWLAGIVLAALSIVGAQIGTRLLTGISDHFVGKTLIAYLSALAIYMAYQGFLRLPP